MQDADRPSFLALLHKTTAAMVIIRSADQRVVTIDDRFERLSGYATSEAIGRSLVELGAFEEGAANIPAIRRKSRVLRWRTKTGDTRECVLSTSQIELAGEPCVALHLVDVTHQQRWKQRQRGERSNFRQLRESMLEGFIELDLSGRIVSANPPLQAMLGYSAEELTRLAYADLLPRPSEDAPAEVTPPAPPPQGPDTRERIYIRKDGTTFPVELRTHLVRDDDGNPARVWVLVRDLTERKAIDQRLVIKGNAVATAINAIALADRRGTLTYVNRAFLELWGHASAEEIVGQPMESLWQDAQAAHLVFDRILARGSWQGEIAARRKDGVVREFQMSAHTVRNTAGELDAMIASFSDATEDRQRARDLRRLSLVAERTSNIVIISDAERRIVWVNDAFTRITGYTFAEAIGRNAGKLLQCPGTAPATIALLRSRLAAHQGVRCEILNRGKQGREYWLDLEIQPLHDPSGALTGFIAVESEITLRKQVEEALRTSERRYRSLVTATSQIVWAALPSGQIMEDSPTWRRYTGQTPEQFQSDWFGAVHPEERAQISQAWQQALQRGAAYEAVWRVRGAEGIYRPFVCRAAPVLNEDGSICEWIGALQDVSAQQQVEARLNEAQRLAKIGSWELEPASGRLIWSDEIFRIFEIDPNSFGASYATFLDAIHPEDRKRVNAAYTQSLRERAPYEIKHRLLMADGRVKFVEERCETDFAPDGTPLRSRGTVQDVTERMRIEENLRQTELAAQALLRNTTVAIGENYFRSLVSELGQTLQAAFVCVAETRGHKATRLHVLAHYSDGQIEMNFDRDVAPGDPTEEVLRRGGPVLIAENLQASHPAGVCGRTDLASFYGLPLRPTGHPSQGILIIGSSRPLKLDPLLRSVLTVFAMRAEAELMRTHTEAEKARLQARLHQNQKAEALGTLAGGIAHDFNNILSGILNYTTLAHEDCVRVNPPAAVYLNEVLQCSRRAKELVRQILVFSRTAKEQREPLYLQGIAQEAIRLLRSTLPASIGIVTQLDPSTPPILANATQMHQVIVNLCINAAHAMDGRVGEITLRVNPCSVDRELAQAQPDLAEGPHVMLAITDTGSGMEETIVSRIFDPFFSTKPADEGTGLGLAVVQSVIKDHEGCIIVSSEPGAGSTFTLYFPLCTAVAPPDIEEASEYPRGHGEHILLVDDEAMVVDSTRVTLERLGYRVTACDNPEEALAQFWANPDEFRVVLTNIQMPGMSGIVLAQRIRTQRPAVTVLATSGFAGSVSPDVLRRAGIADLLLKPIAKADLARALALATKRPGLS